MAYLIGLILFAMAAVLVLIILYQGTRKTVDFLSVRNVFLTGFIIFQLVSGGLVLIMNQFDVVRVNDPGGTGAVFALLATIFLSVFWVFCWRLNASYWKDVK